VSRNREGTAEDFIGAGAEAKEGSIGARGLDGLNVREGGADWLGQRLSWERCCSFGRHGSQGEGMGSFGRLGSFSSLGTSNRLVTMKLRVEGRRRFGPVSDRVSYGSVEHRVKERYRNLR
jgi:hypothetical protein